MSAAPAPRHGECTPWTPAEDQKLEAYMWMQRPTPQVIVTRGETPAIEPAPVVTRTVRGFAKPASCA